MTETLDALDPVTPEMLNILGNIISFLSLSEMRRLISILCMY